MSYLDSDDSDIDQDDDYSNSCDSSEDVILAQRQLAAAKIAAANKTSSPVAAKTPQFAASVMATMQQAKPIAGIVATPVAGSNTLDKEVHLETVTYGIDQTIPVKTLMAQADRGKELRLTWGNGIVSAVFSNPAHDTPESNALGAIDVICGDASAELEQNSGTNLLLTTAHPLTKGRVAANRKSDSKEAPFGLLSFNLNANGTKVSVPLHLALEAWQFKSMFPGLTKAKLSTPIRATTMDPTETHLHKDLELTKVYQADPQVIAQGKQITAFDIKGNGYANLEHAERIRKHLEKVVETNFAHCDVTNKMKQVFVLSLPHENMRVSEHQPSVLSQGNLGVFVHTKGLQSAAARGLSRSLVQNAAGDICLRIRGSITLPYFKDLVGVATA